MTATRVVTRPRNEGGRYRIAAFLSLLTSTSTLLCCALPALLAAVAGGSAVVALVSTFPFLVPLSRHKFWLFLVTALLLTWNGYLLFQKRGSSACPTDDPQACQTARGWACVLFWVAVTLFFIGLSFSYLLPPLLRWLDTL